MNYPLNKVFLFAKLDEAVVKAQLPDCCCDRAVVAARFVEGPAGHQAARADLRSRSLGGRFTHEFAQHGDVSRRSRRRADG